MTFFYFLSCSNGLHISLWQVRIIMEITIRKCGLKVVELIAPEKYQGFIRTVVEVTHGFMLTWEFMINLYLIVLFYKLHSGCAANDPPIKH